MKTITTILFMTCAMALHAQLTAFQTTTGDCNTNCTANVQIDVDMGTPPYVVTLMDLQGTAITETWQNFDSWAYDNICDGQYTYTVEDNAGGTIVENFYVGLLDIDSITTTLASCNGFNDGTASVHISNWLQATFTAHWNPGGFAGLFPTDLGAGDHILTITTSNCFSQDTITIEEPDAISVTNQIVDESFGNDGEIHISISGGTPSYSMDWSGPNGFSLLATSDTSITNLEAGNYTVNFTDNMGCTYNDNFLVNSTVGLQENTTDIQFLFNPSNQEITLVTDQIIKSSDVISLAGQRVYTSNESANVIDTSNLPKGQYVIHVQTATTIFSKVITINK